MHRRILTSALALAAGAAIAATASDLIYAPDLPLNHPAIAYSTGEFHDPVAGLMARLASGEVKLAKRDGPLGYLPAVLEALQVPVDSQALVFSKTSFQAPKISPRNPRAVYFSDDVAVGWVRNGDGVELAALDPVKGIVFYTVNDSPTGAKIERQEVCMKCHQGPATTGVPGWFISSVFPSSTGAAYRNDAIVTDHRTPFEDRWGGWYVLGQHGDQKHRGNAVAPDPAEPETLETEDTQNLDTLVRKFDAKGYLTPQSDIVALMTFEHQTQMVNLMTRASWLAKMAEADHKTDSKTLNDIQSTIEELVSYMLFAEEAPLKAPVKGVSTFTETFPTHGPRDHKGRSLRDFDLNARLFKYPLSYMIYSPAFDAMPDIVREPVLRRIYNALTGPSGNREIIEILADTKPSLPAYWRDVSASRR